MQQEQQKKLNKEEHTENLNVFENRVHRKSSPFKITEAGSGETPMQLLQLAHVTCWLRLKSHKKSAPICANLVNPSIPKMEVLDACF